MRRARTTLTASVIAAAILCAGAAQGDAAARAGSKPGDGQGGFRSKRIGTFSSPVYVTGPRGADGKLFVVEQEGVIKVLPKSGKGKPRKFLDISRKVEAGGERGLLSVAFDPHYSRNGLFYVYYTRSGGDIVIEEHRAGKRKGGGRALRAKPGGGRRMLTVEHSENSNHNGGQLQFGPDGLLYIGTGDGGSAYDPPENAQNKDSLLGKMLRIDPHRKGKRSYTVPSSNPFVGKSGQAEVFSLGLRNPFRFSFDRRSKALVIGDVGQDQWEEVDYESIKSANGANFGWDALEGTHPLGTDPSPVPAGAVPPIFQYSHDSGNCSITGGFVSRDKRIRSLWGRYLYADFCKGEIRSLIPSMNGARGDSKTGLPSSSGVSTFGEDSKGHLYFANLGGEVFAIVPNGKRKR